MTHCKSCCKIAKEVNLMAKRAQFFDPRQTMSGTFLEVFHNYDEQRRYVDLHHHDFFEIYYFISGDVEYRVEGKSYILQTGDLLLISPGVFHQPVVTPGTAYERIVLWIDRSYLMQFLTYGADLSMCFDASGATLLHPSSYQRTSIAMLLEQLCKESHSTKYGSSLFCHGLFLQVMIQINRMAPHASSREDPAEEPELISQVLAYISDHYKEKLTLQELADRFYVSKYHLSHEFSSRVGTSIYRYIILKRLLAAREQIAEGIAPSEVCQSCGFQDYANFYRAFKAEYGMSPKAFATSQEMTVLHRSGT